MGEVESPEVLRPGTPPFADAVAGPDVVPVPPTRAAAFARIAAVRPEAYARTRNSIGGAVSGLSPYLTHGLVDLREVLAGVAWRYPLEVRDKFVQELGWRAYFRHVWSWYGEGILQSLNRGPLADAFYARTVPADIREARTGVPAIDMAVRTLYRTGGLHNHARMWLASYCVHLRKVHWRAGADWMLGHLLDGDIGSNHLSWQWVAGTASRKSYLFDAENVARHAPVEWHSPGTAIDVPREHLSRLAHDARSVGVEGAAEVSGVAEPRCTRRPLDGWRLQDPDADAVRGRDVWLVHPWSLGPARTNLPAGTVTVPVLVDEAHARWPWSARRWSFVGRRMAEIAPSCWCGDLASMATALAGARRVRMLADPHVTLSLGQVAEGVEPAPLFPAVDAPCDSFTQWWLRATRGLRTAEDLLAVHAGAEG
jgi:deoxyribodipyrimidine photo-lyase